MLTFGSLFAGIGGFDLGLERAGMKCKWQVEIDEHCRRVLTKHWPDVPRWDDVRTFPPGPVDEWQVDLICGGDPCPKHSNARRGQASRHPDLSGYFLALVGRLRPRWVVRENVPSPTVEHFDAAMEALGYGTIVVEADAADFTRQQRCRWFVVGLLGRPWPELVTRFGSCEVGGGNRTPRLAMAPKIACLITHRTRNNTDDNYVWDGQRFRRLSANERERFSGFPVDWTAGASEAMRARMCGNAVVPQVAQWIGQRIVETDAIGPAGQ